MTAMEIDTSAALEDSSTTPFTVESLSKSLQPIAKQALTTNAENAATNYDALETQLRSHVLSIVAENDLVRLQQEWTACWKLCIYLLEQCPDLNRFIRKLPFVLLEDIVECLPLPNVEQFWESVNVDALCSGILWESPDNQSHVLQYIRLQNTLLSRLSLSSQHAGTILMQMAKTLPLSDRSALKLWGSVSGRTTEYNQDEDDEEDESFVANLHDDALTNQEQQEAQSFHQVFWSVQHDMANPYSISFANFFKNMKTILAALESKSLTTTTTATLSTLPSTSKYLTKRRLLPLQLQDAAFLKHWLTQFLIIESFVSSQSTQLKTTLGDLSNRAKALLRKLPGGNQHLETLQHILHNSEVLWRQWKKSKCKPDMELLTADTSTTEESMDTSTDLPTRLSFQKPRLTLQDLQETAKTMAVPSLESHLENYVDALDPEAGIEAEYHPKNDKLHAWRSLRLLGRQHLNYFSSIRRSDGDFERMVREIYKHERSVDIPGEMPEQDVELDYDENLGQETKEKEAEEEAAKVVEEETTSPPDATDEKDVAEKSNVEPDTVQESQDLKEEMKVDEPKLSSYAEMAGGEECVPEAQEEEDNKDVGEESKQDESPEEEKESLEAESPAEPMDEGTPSEPPDDSGTVEKEEVGPTKTEPLTPFEQAAMEEEAILLAEHEEEEAKAAAAKEKETGKEEPPTKDASKEESKQEAPKKETTDDRKRKRDISDGSTADENAAKRSRPNQGRSTSDQSQQRGRHDNRMGREQQHDDRRGNWGGRGAGRGGGGRGQNMPPPRRSPPPPHQGGPSQQQQRPPPGRGGSGGDGGRGRVPGRGGGGRGDDGRRQPQRRDARRRY